MKATQTLHNLGQSIRRAAQANLYIKIPGTKEGLPAIEEATFTGVRISVTLLFSRE
jgi:transaldolase